MTLDLWYDLKEPHNLLVVVSDISGILNDIFKGRLTHVEYLKANISFKETEVSVY